MRGGGARYPGTLKFSVAVYTVLLRFLRFHLNKNKSQFSQIAEIGM